MSTLSKMIKLPILTESKKHGHCNCASTGNYRCRTRRLSAASADAHKVDGTAPQSTHGASPDDVPSQRLPEPEVSKDRDR